jgi:hypothetical protein
MIPIDGTIPQFANLQESSVLGLERRVNFFASILFLHCPSACDVIGSRRQVLRINLHILT